LSSAAPATKRPAQPVGHAGAETTDVARQTMGVLLAEALHGGTPKLEVATLGLGFRRERARSRRAAAVM
jgi:hypothetical protein